MPFLSPVGSSERSLSARRCYLGFPRRFRLRPPPIPRIVYAVLGLAYLYRISGDGFFAGDREGDVGAVAYKNAYLFAFFVVSSS